MNFTEQSRILLERSKNNLGETGIITYTIHTTRSHFLIHTHTHSHALKHILIYIHSCMPNLTHTYTQTHSHMLTNTLTHSSSFSDTQQRVGELKTQAQSSRLLPTELGQTITDHDTYI